MICQVKDIVFFALKDNSFRGCLRGSNQGPKSPRSGPVIGVLGLPW